VTTHSSIFQAQVLSDLTKCN